MIKEEISQELQAEFKKGNLKPSQLKKSKSLSDLPKSFQPETLRRKSINLLTNPNSLKKQLVEAQDEISTLGLQVEIQGRELTEFKEEKEHLKEQGKIKQQTIEELRKNLEEKNSQLSQTQTELDQSLAARVQSLKDFGSEYEKRVKAESELEETIQQSAQEINHNDQTITNLRSQLFKAQQQVNNLARDLDLSQRVNELRNKAPYFEPEFSSLTYFKYGIYALLAVGFCLILRRRDV